jgi:hypothetical protein
MVLAIDTHKGKKQIKIDTDMDHNFRTVYTAEMVEAPYTSVEGSSAEDVIKKIQKRIDESDQD